MVGEEDEEERRWMDGLMNTNKVGKRYRGGGRGPVVSVLLGIFLGSMAASVRNSVSRTRKSVFHPSQS